MKHGKNARESAPDGGINPSQRADAPNAAYAEARGNAERSVGKRHRKLYKIEYMALCAKKSNIPLAFRLQGVYNRVSCDEIDNSLSILFF